MASHPTPRFTDRAGDAAHSPLRVACVQLVGGSDVGDNLRRAKIGFDAAVARGAQFVALPEKWNLSGEPQEILAGAEPLDGRSMTAIREWTRAAGVWCLAGSIAERIDGEARCANTSALIQPDGDVQATYRKIHMFDVEVGGVSYRESDAERGGSELVVADMDGIGVGMSVCYDLRFPELYRILALRDARILTVPAAFTLYTGRDHWEVLLRARAIENQCYVVAPGMIGDHGHGKVSYGRSMIIDPWGTVLAQAPDAEAVVVADLDFSYLQNVRAQLPSFASRRPETYRWPQ